MLMFYVDNVMRYFLVFIKNYIFFNQSKMSEQSQYVFITKLSNEQKNYLTSLLPLRYSFQPGTVSTNKNVVKKMNNFVKEEIVV